MSDQITQLLGQIDRLDQEATKAPWITYGGSDSEYGEYTNICNTFHNGNTPDLDIVAHVYDDKSSAELIALARTFAPAAAKALRAVMEIHKPFHADHYYNGMDGESLHRFVLRCDGCEESGGIEDYPCPTVQAITDTLGDDNAG